MNNDDQSQPNEQLKHSPQNTPNPSEPSRLEASDAQNAAGQQLIWKSWSHVDAHDVTRVGFL